jgi:hypothetical protein
VPVTLRDRLALPQKARPCWRTNLTLVFASSSKRAGSAPLWFVDLARYQPDLQLNSHLLKLFPQRKILVETLHCFFDLSHRAVKPRFGEFGPYTTNVST